MRLTLHVWRQPRGSAAGRFVRYEVPDATSDMSFLELLDVLNEQLLARHEEPVAFDSDCREGICGACGVVINGEPHGPQTGTATCQLHLRHFPDGAELWVEPWRARGFPVVKDLVIDRAAFDRIIQAGGFITARTGSAPEANTTLVPKRDAETAMDAAECIACGACVAACPNASAMLFVAAKTSHLGQLPQGQPERYSRTIAMVRQMEREGFGSCTNHAECTAACPKEISIDFIARLNRDFLTAVRQGAAAPRVEEAEL
ncbi:MAG TPA: succinate dehydrogenase/fumarate reductase iron-sulfur subunit [Gemmatimonadales bacterium]|nr:succinate dehydrogenase/fumarate reductase iron-sulfur subunit [Gemmatimonadales bacterium]